MSDTTIITLEVSVQYDRMEDLPVVAESMLAGAVSALSSTRRACGLTYSYEVVKKVRRTGLTISAKPPSAGVE